MDDFHLPPEPSNVRVLYVDDEADIRELVRRQLCPFFCVETASCASEAMAKLQSSDPFTVLISDLSMPAMDGVQLLQTVRAENPRMIGILLTGNADLDSAMRAVNEARAFRYLTKPCKAAALVESVQAGIREHLELTTSVEHNDVSTLPTAMPETDASLQRQSAELVGRLVDRRYQVQRKLGEGSQAVVYEVTDGTLRQKMALKVFRAAADPEQFARIKREVSIARRLIHPSITRVHDIGMDGEHVFLSMELLKGLDLREHLAKAPLPMTFVLDVLLQAAAALDHAHSKQIHHRDVKPENFFVQNDGALKLVDFGLAKSVHSSQITAPGAIGGTLGYMAPEQLEGLNLATHLSDTYSLGVVAYELVCGVLPYRGSNPLTLIRNQVAGKPAAPSTMRTDLSTDLEALILQMLENAPDRRPASCEEVAQKLLDIRERHQLSQAFEQRVRG